MKRQAVKKLIQCAAVIAAGVLAIILFMLAIWYRGKNSEPVTDEQVAAQMQQAEPLVIETPEAATEGSIRVTLLLLVCIVGCSQAKDSDNHVVQDYSEEYEVSPYGSEEALDTLGDLKISMSTEKDLDLKHLSFLIENTSDKEYQYSPDYFEIEAEQSGTWYQLKQLDDPSKSNEKDCFIKPNERLTLEIDVKSFYGELPAGHYRLIKQFAFFESERDWDYDTYNLSCEFTIR